jgi:hypothetical protein
LIFSKASFCESLPLDKSQYICLSFRFILTQVCLGGGGWN